MANLSKHPILMQAHNLIQEIEKCGCSEQVTKAVTDAGALMTAIDELIEDHTARWSKVDREMVERVMANCDMPSPGPERDVQVAFALGLTVDQKAPIYLRTHPWSSSEEYAAEALRVWMTGAPAHTRREVEIVMSDPMYRGRRVTLKQVPDGGTLASHLTLSDVADTTPDAATRTILVWYRKHAAP